MTQERMTDLRSSHLLDTPFLPRIAKMVKSAEHLHVAVCA